MRPRSILLFEKLWLTGLALLALASVARHCLLSPQGLLPDGSIVRAALAVGELLVIALPAWFFVARKGSRVARMFLCMVAIWGIIGLTRVASAAWSLNFAYGTVVVMGWVLQYAGTALLFRQDADAWLANRGRPVPSVADAFR